MKPQGVEREQSELIVRTRIIMKCLLIRHAK